jgi:hypothetical protein
MRRVDRIRDAGVRGCCQVTNEGRYDPATDSWSPIASMGALAAWNFQSAFWTGTEAIAWTGRWHRYNVASDSWSLTPDGPATPASNGGYSAVWTGTEMIVWGGGSSGQQNTEVASIPQPTPGADVDGRRVPSARTRHSAGLDRQRDDRLGRSNSAALRS